MTKRRTEVEQAFQSGTRSVVHGVAHPATSGDASELLPYVPNAHVYDRADWTSLRPPANTRTQERWSKAITPVRAILLGILWLTYAWWRPLILLALLGTIATLIIVAVA